MEKIKRFFVLFFIASLGISSFGSSSSDSSIYVYDGLSKAPAEFSSDTVIVKFKKDSKFQTVKLSQSKRVEDSVNEYLSQSDVEYAEPDYVSSASFLPNDPKFNLQWHLDNSNKSGINATSAWDVTGGDKVIVAVIDTGVAYENYGNYAQAPDLANTCFVQGYDFVNNDSHPNDDHSHGTHVAGTIAQSSNNGVGVAGVAYRACIMPIKVLNSSGSGNHSAIAAGIRYAADNGAKVISMSLGGPGSQTMLDAVKYAYSKGVTVIAAAGNSGQSPISYPAGYNDYVIAVGATRYDMKKAPYSSYGAGLDVVAPGGDTKVDQNGDGYPDGVLQNTFNPNTKDTKTFGYWFFQGTSMATPHVAGVAAMVISAGINGPDNVRKAIEKTARDQGSSGWDQYFGWGIIDAEAAIRYNNPNPTPTPNPTPIPSPYPTPTPTPDPSPTPVPTPTPLPKPSPSPDPDSNLRVSFVSPADNETVSGLIKVKVAVSGGNVRRIRFYSGNRLIGIALNSSPEILWHTKTVANGEHVITAKAYDSDGKTASASITVNVKNGSR